MRIKNLAITAALAAASLTLRTACPAQQAAGKQNPYDAQAVRLLQEMAEAYTHLSAFRQETEFSSAIMPLVPLPLPVELPTPAEAEGARGARKGGAKDLLNSERKLDRKLRLAFAAPNRLRLEVEDADESGNIQVATWASDGKSFWTYNPEKNLFSREKAPKKIQEFARLAHMTSGSLEILMLMGVNPFAHVEEQTEGVRLAGKETIRGVATDIVAMSADLGPTATETRLYIGVEDHLLYRLTSETSQKPKTARRTTVGSPLDELAPPEPSSQPLFGNPEDPPPLPGVLMKSRVVCDNKMDVNPKFDFNAFVYQPPAGALYLTNPIENKSMTMKQRIAELNKNTRRQKKSPPRVYRF